MTTPHEMGTVVKNVQEAGDQLTFLLEQISQNTYANVAELRQRLSCARRQVCGSGRPKYECAENRLNDSWHKLKYPCYTPVNTTEQNIPSMFETWVLHAGANPTYSETCRSKALATFKSIQLPLRQTYTWSPQSGTGCILKGNPFVDLNENGIPLTWADIWGDNGKKYLKEVVPVVEGQERLYNDLRAQPFAPIDSTIPASILLYRIGKSSSGRNPWPRNWPSGARVKEDFESVKMELSNAGYSDPLVLSQGYNVDEEKPSNIWFTVKLNEDNKLKYVEQAMWNSVDELKTFVEKKEKQKKTVAVWLPFMFNGEEITSLPGMTLLKRNTHTNNLEVTDDSTIGVFPPDPSSSVNLAAAVAMEPDFNRQIMLFKRGGARATRVGS
jgi:hypothetical protein